MKVKILSREFVFEMKKVKKKEEREKKHFEKRFLGLVVLFFCFGFFIEYSKLKVDYKVGSVATSDIIAPKNAIYLTDLVDDILQDRILQTTTPEYDKIPGVNRQTIISINKFFREIKLLQTSSDEEIQSYIHRNKYDFTTEDIRNLIKRNEDYEYTGDISDYVSKIYSAGILKKEDLEEVARKKDLEIDYLDMKLLKNFLKPNLKINDKETEKKVADSIDFLKNREIKIYKGDIIVRKGEVIDANAYLKLKKLNLIRTEDKVKKVIGLTCTFIIAMSLLYYVLKKNSRDVIESNVYFAVCITMIILNLIYVCTFNKFPFIVYLIPFTTLPIITTILGNRMFAAIITFMDMIILSREEFWLFIMIAMSLAAIYKADKLTNRSDVIKISLFLGIFQSIITFSYGMVNQMEITLIGVLIIESVGSGILTGVLTVGLLPYFENTFDILTDIKLLELSDFSHTLLKQLLLKASGTFHHSIMVGALAESAAESIGANATFARIASYYHDIGKMKRPEFFVENQGGGVNPHNKIKPSLSALILTSHTKDGYIMGKENKLPKEILNVILEHHGTTLTQYFYYKALESGEEVIENNFRYSGPKPSTKESGIILLADTVEAATRTLENKSKENIERFIRYLVKTKIEDNQLSNANLTLGEIEKIIQSFVVTLRGVYHERIKYPKMDEKIKK
ncbi:HD family phosphohydrolase [Leptotrichia sp. oral taxon 847]|uniref:HD family phosphohydrolase n=1 Tax=Leptotrichia sp. oral taxon 847 TaxID=1785996 RepID=UPI0007682BA6|nr:HDIG domain-containing metalloprotein [Leptotrichia sp. oral taxon 847]AMD94487.1 phosphohydrolase [Leptotrichia sp. oral taxon 847]